MVIDLVAHHVFDEMMLWLTDVTGNSTMNLDQRVAGALEKECP